MNRRLSNQKGLAAIEFLWISPLIVIFMAMSAELGNLFVDYQLLNKAVRMGARYAVTETYGTTGAKIADELEIKNVVVSGDPTGLSSPLINGLSVDDVTVTTINGLVTVSATYPYAPIFVRIPFINVDTSMDLTAASVMLARVSGE